MFIMYVLIHSTKGPIICTSVLEIVQIKLVVFSTQSQLCHFELSKGFYEWLISCNFEVNKYDMLTE